MSSATLNFPVPMRDVACQELVRYDVYKQGFLRLRGVFNKVVDNFVTKSTGSLLKLKWRTVYVVLDKGCLYVFSSETATAAKKATSLYGFNMVTECGEELAHVPVSWPFKLVSEIDYNERTFYFSASSQVEMKGWISAITQQMILANGASAVEERNKRRPLPAVVDPSPLSTARPTPGVKANRPCELTLADKERLNFVHPDNSVDDDDDVDDYDVINEAELAKQNSTDDDKKLKSPVSPLNKLNLSPQPNAGRVQLLPPINDSQPPRMQLKPLDEQKPGAKPPPTVPKNPQTPPVRDSSKPVTLPKPPLLKDKPPVKHKPPIQVREQPNDFPPGYYAIKPTDNDLIDFAAEAVYEGGEEYFAMSKGGKALQQRQRAVDDAFWPYSPKEGEQLMGTFNDDGVYMIRQSKGSNGDKQTLMVRICGVVRKYYIFNNEDDKFAIDTNGPWFGSKTSLLAHYKRNHLPNQPAAMLTDPYTKFMSS